MPPQSRGNPLPTGRYSVSTPNLPTQRSADTDSSSTLSTSERPTPSAADPAPASPSWTESPSEPASIDDFSLDTQPTQFSSGSDSTSASSDDDDEQTPISQMPLRPSLSNQHSKSQTYLISSFAPPFYNRPPTPLPPSPSLTSLLRPNFSASASRPTTPDHSSDDNNTTTTTGGGGGTGAPSTRAASQTRSSTAAASTLLTSSFRTARPIPRASPKVPTYEYYGFTLYLASSLIYLLYLLWSFLPSPFLHQLGIYYYPNRWWSLAIPAWLVMLVLWIYVALAGYNTGYLTMGMERIEGVVDEAAQVAAVDGKGRVKGRGRRGTIRAGSRRRKGGEAEVGLGRRASVRVEEDVLDWKAVWSEGTDAVMDIPVGGVCEVLYGEAREDYGMD